MNRNIKLHYILYLLAYFLHIFGQNSCLKIKISKLCEELKITCHNIHTIAKPVYNKSHWTINYIRSRQDSS